MISRRILVPLAVLGMVRCSPAHAPTRGAATPSAPSAAAIAVAFTRLTREPAPVAKKAGTKIVFHDVRLDETDALLPAFDVDAPLAHAAALGFRAFADIPPAKNGYKPYFFVSMFAPTADETFAPYMKWFANPTGLSAMLVRSGVRWYAWSGDRKPLDDARALVDHVLAHGLSGAKDDWARVPFASAEAGELEIRGGDDAKHCEDKTACGRGDGRGVLEPDKIGEFGHALVLMNRFTGEKKYLEAAIACADALASHVTPGDDEHSPWPFRVDAATGKKVREAYTTNWVFTLEFFDALGAAGAANDAHRNARAIAWAWLMKHPVVTNLWQAFFEDIPIFPKPGLNPNQYSAGETARYLLDHPSDDPDAIVHARSILSWIDRTFTVDVDSPIGITPGHWYGAEVLSEQGADMAKMGSHTARFASVLARLYEATNEVDLRARARRSFAWATYCIDPRGVVKVGPDDREGYWFSDGYGDYLIHFLDGMASVPAWAPRGEAHVLRTNDVLVDVAYERAALRYRGTSAGVESIRVPGAPRVTIDGVEVRAGESAAVVTEAIPEGGALVTIRRATARSVSVTW